MSVAVSWNLVFGEMVKTIFDFYGIREDDEETLQKSGAANSSTIRRWKNGQFPSHNNKDMLLDFLKNKLNESDKGHSDCAVLIKEILKEYDCEAHFAGIYGKKPLCFIVEALEICYRKKPKKSKDIITNDSYSLTNWTDLLIKCRIVDLTQKITKVFSTYLSNDNEMYFAEIEQEPPNSSMGIDFKVSKITSLRLNHGTHIDFPGHINDKRFKQKTVSSYPLKEFISEALIYDASDKVKTFHKVFEKRIISNKSLLQLSNDETFWKEFFNEIANLVITKDEFCSKIDDKLENKSVLIFTGLGKCYWDYVNFNSHNIGLPLYCINPFMEAELAEYLVDENVRIVGVDSWQVDNPIINFESLPIYLPENVKNDIKSEVDKIRSNNNHQIFLGDGKVLIMENLDLNELKGCERALLVCPPIKLDFPGCNDNSITRACALVFKGEKN